MSEHFTTPASPQRVDRATQPLGSVVSVAGVEVGGSGLVVMAGPCAVESRDQIVSTARAVARAGAAILRGGAFKPRTSPYSFQGLEEEGLALLAEARRITGLPVVTEVLDPRHLAMVADVADMLQVGSRNMHNVALLKEVGQADIPVLLKRGMAATIDELLFAAEYIVSRGNEEVALCERGIRTFTTSTRNTLDLNAVPILKRRTHLPVIADPSHGTGHAWMVPHLARAAVAAGADGLLIEVHTDPARALSDGAQSLSVEDFETLMPTLDAVAAAVGRNVSALPGRLSAVAAEPARDGSDSRGVG